MKAGKYYFLYLMGIVVFLFSCRKKEYPESVVVNSPVFLFTGNIDGRQVTYVAGDNGYYMSGSFTQNSNKVYEFTSGFMHSACQGCGETLKIKFTDRKVSSVGAPVQIDSVLSFSNNFTFLSGPSYSVQFSSAFNKPVLSYLWDFGDGTTSALANPTHTYTQQGKYNVSLKMTSVNGCVSVIHSTQKIGYSNSPLVNIGVSSVSGNTVSFNAQVTGNSPFQYYWQFGDGTSSALPSPIHTYPVSGAYPVKLRVIDAVGDTSYASYNAVTQFDASSCAANYTIGAPAQLVAPLNLSACVIEWTDASGQKFSSDDWQQPSGSKFKIISVEDFQNNENGDRTKKVKVQFTCRVYNGTNFKVITNAEAIISVAYK